MESSLFSKFSWFLVLTTLSQRLSGYFTFPVVWLICIWLLIRCHSSLCMARLLSAPVPCLSLLCPVSPVDCAAHTPVSTAFIWHGFSSGRHRHEKPRSFPQPLCLGRCLQGRCNSFGLQFPLDSSSFWLVVSALGFQEHDLLIFLPMYGGGAYYLFLDCSTILWWASCSSITCVVNSHILNSFYLKYKWFLLFWGG